MTALALHDVAKSRGRGRHQAPALRGISLTVAAGEFVLIEGPSGSGKTTLLAVAGGILTPDRGSVVLAGRDLGSLSGNRRRELRAQSVGFVFQRACLLERLSAHDNVRLAAALAGVPVEQGAREAEALLEQLGIAPLAARRPHELSGGEEQRVAVARALVHRPAIVLADEPTACLDRSSGHAVAEALASLARIRGAAVLVATHDPRLAAFATRRLSLVDGTLRQAA